MLSTADSSETGLAGPTTTMGLKGPVSIPQPALGGAAGVQCQGVGQGCGVLL